LNFNRLTLKSYSSVLSPVRHSECMKHTPTDVKSQGPHDCIFDTKIIECKCKH